MFLEIIIQIMIWLLFVVVVFRNVMVGRKKKGKNFFAFLSRIISLLFVILGVITPLPIYPLLVVSIILLFVDYRVRLNQPEMGAD